MENSENENSAFFILNQSEFIDFTDLKDELFFLCWINTNSSKTGNLGNSSKLGEIL